MRQGDRPSDVAASEQEERRPTEDQSQDEQEQHRAGVRAVARQQGLAPVVVIDRREARDPLAVRNDAVDHVEHDENEEQASGPTRRRASLRGELREEQSDATDHSAKQREVQTEKESIPQAEVAPELLPTG